VRGPCPFQVDTLDPDDYRATVYSSQRGFDAIFELPPWRLRNYAFIYRRSPAIQQSVLDFPAPLNMGIAHL
jgi:hypothetical protein